MEKRYTHVDDIQVVILRVCIQESRGFFVDEIEFIHIIALSDELVYGEIIPKAVIGL